MHSLRQKITFGILLSCIILIQIIRYFPEAGEFYARHIYPVITRPLSLLSDLFPFSLGDCFIFISCISLIVYLFYSFRRTKFRHRLLHILYFLCTVYIWFYFAWGLNYFRENFYQRNRIPYITYSAGDFKNFLQTYLTQLNREYTLSDIPDSLSVANDIQRQYTDIASKFGLIRPQRTLKAKKMLFSRMMSKVGVTGYMGPFFTEFNLNRELLPVEYPAVYAHELAHRLSISSEAEANFYAWLTCTRSDIPAIRYSGHFLIFGYMVNNASRLLTKEEFQDFVSSVRPEIIEQYKAYQNYWRSKYSPFTGKIQQKIYNLFLKSNRVSSGTKNYSEVIGMIISWEHHRSTTGQEYQKNLPRPACQDKPNQHPHLPVPDQE